MQWLAHGVSLLATVTMAACATTGARSGTGDCDSDAYREAINRMLQADQLHRGAISWGTTDQDEINRLSALPEEAQMAEQVRRIQTGVKLAPDVEDELWGKQIALDSANVRELMSWMDMCGWPTETLLGADAPSVMPILLHMSMEDAAWVLPELKREVLADRMPPRPYATIYDRKRQHDGEPQLYGTIKVFDPRSQAPLPPAIVDLEATNAARAEIGLGPIGEHRITDAETAAGR